MSESMVYNIPLEMIEAYRGRPVVVRAKDPGDLPRLLTDSDLGLVQFVQLDSVAADFNPLANWGMGVAIDVLMREPESEFALLYNCSKLLDKHPVRITIPAKRGLAKAVKVAGSLNFAVKLAVGQPDAVDIGEMRAALEMFLHQPSFSQPVEFFNGTLRSFFSGEAVTTWALQEEDPANGRYITDDGRETISPRFFDLATDDLDGFINRFNNELLIQRKECYGCEFLSACQGYFKWPNRDYICDGGVKELYSLLRDASAELKADLSYFSAAAGELQI